MYYESRGLSDTSQIIVGQVILNRAIASNEDVCVIVRKPNQFYYKAQIPQTKEYQHTKSLAAGLLAGAFPDYSKGAVYFHNLRDRPKWSYRKKFLFQLEGHRYYANK